MTKTPTYNYAHIKSDQFAKTKLLPLGNAIDEKLEQFYTNVSNDGYILAVGTNNPEVSPAVLLTSPKNMPELKFKDYSRDKFLANMGTVTVEGGKKLPSSLKSPSVPLAVFKDAEARNIDVKAGCTVITDTSTAINTTFNGNNILAGDTHVAGGTLEYLSAAGNVTIKTTGELKHCTFAGNVTIDGNVSLAGIDLHGDVHFSTNPGSDHIVIRRKNEHSAHAVYDLAHLKARDKGFNYSITRIYLSVTLQALKEYPGVLDATLCMSHSVHSQHMNNCRCALWSPLLRLAEPVAMHYLLRAEGLLDTSNEAGSPLRDGSFNNPLSSLSKRLLEETMYARACELEETYDKGNWYETEKAIKSTLKKNYVHAGLVGDKFIWRELWGAYSN